MYEGKSLNIHTILMLEKHVKTFEGIYFYLLAMENLSECKHDPGKMVQFGSKD